MRFVAIITLFGRVLSTSPQKCEFEEELWSDGTKNKAKEIVRPAGEIEFKLFCELLDSNEPLDSSFDATTPEELVHNSLTLIGFPPPGVCHGESCIAARQKLLVPAIDILTKKCEFGVDQIPLLLHPLVLAMHPTVEKEWPELFSKQICRWFQYLFSGKKVSEIIDSELMFLKQPSRLEARCGSDDWTEEVKRFADTFGPTPSGPRGELFCTLLSYYQEQQQGRQITVEDIVRAMVEAISKNYFRFKYFGGKIPTFELEVGIFRNTLKCGVDVDSDEKTMDFLIKFVTFLNHKIEGGDSGPSKSSLSDYFKPFEFTFCRWFNYLRSPTPPLVDEIIEFEFDYLKSEPCTCEERYAFASRIHHLSSYFGAIDSQDMTATLAEEIWKYANEFDNEFFIYAGRCLKTSADTQAFLEYEWGKVPKSHQYLWSTMVLSARTRGLLSESQFSGEIGATIDGSECSLALSLDIIRTLRYNALENREHYYHALTGSAAENNFQATLRKYTKKCLDSSEKVSRFLKLAVFGWDKPDRNKKEWLLVMTQNTLPRELFSEEQYKQILSMLKERGTVSAHLSSVK